MATATVVPSIRQLAPYIGISHTMLNRQLKAGRFKEEPGGGFDVEKVRAALSENIPVAYANASKTASSQSGSHAVYNNAKAFREGVRAKLDELELKRRQGELVALADVREFETRMVAACKTELQVIGPELADDLAACEDPQRCRFLVVDRIDKALRRLAAFAG